MLTLYKCKEVPVICISTVRNAQHMYNSTMLHAKPFVLSTNLRVAPCHLFFQNFCRENKFSLTQHINMYTIAIDSSVQAALLQNNISCKIKLRQTKKSGSIPNEMQYNSSANQRNAIANTKTFSSTRFFQHYTDQVQRRKKKQLGNEQEYQFIFVLIYDPGI